MLTDEERKAAEAAEKVKAEAEAKAKKEAEEAEEARLAGLSDEEKKAEEAKKAEKERQENYEAELKRERDRAEKAEKALADKAFKDRELKRKKEEAGDPGDEDDDDKPITKKDLSDILVRERKQIQSEVMGGRISQIAKEISKSELEAQLIIEIHKNRQFPSDMPLEEQLEEAQAIANRKRHIQTEAELRRALKSKETASHENANTEREPIEPGEPQMSAQDRSAITSSGMKWDGKAGFYKKTLPSKRTLFYDPKNKKRWVQ